MINKNLDEIELDILKEVGNIGAGNAATSLSEMLDTRVDLEIPFVKNCLLPELPMIMGGAEQFVNALFLKVHKSLNGMILFILGEEDGQKLYKLASRGYDIDFEPVILEVSNIISGTYVSALATMIDETIDITPPQLGQDMLGALVGSAIPSMFPELDKISVIGTKLIVDNQVISGYYILMLDNESINKLVEYLKEKAKRYD